MNYTRNAYESNFIRPDLCMYNPVNLIARQSNFLDEIGGNNDPTIQDLTNKGLWNDGISTSVQVVKKPASGNVFTKAFETIKEQVSFLTSTGNAGSTQRSNNWIIILTVLVFLVLILKK